MAKPKLKDNLVGIGRRNDTSMAKCLEIVTSNPGILSAAIASEYRRFLRKLELDGKIQYRNEGWFLNEKANN